MIVTLCGSTRFKDEYEIINKKFTLQGHCVFSCIFFKDDNPTEEQKKILDKVHFQKIKLSDGIFVINQKKYVNCAFWGSLKKSCSNL